MERKLPALLMKPTSSVSEMKSNISDSFKSRASALKAKTFLNKASTKRLLGTKRNPLRLNRVETKVGNIRNRDTFTDILGKFYTLFKEDYEEKLKRKQLKKDFRKERDTEKLKKHNEIIDALKSVSKSMLDQDVPSKRGRKKESTAEKEPPQVPEAVAPKTRGIPKGTSPEKPSPTSPTTAPSATKVPSGSPVQKAMGVKPSPAETPINMSARGAAGGKFLNAGLFTRIPLKDGATEVREGGTISWRNNNPGNLRYTDFTKKMGAIGQAGGFAVFPTMESGENARKELLFGNTTYKNLNVRQAITKYAPPNENNTEDYIKKVTTAIGVPDSTPISSLTEEQKKKWLKASEKAEGFTPGKVTVIKDGPTNIPKKETPTPITPTPKIQGEKVGDISIESNDLKKEMNKNRPVVVMNNNTTAFVDRTVHTTNVVGNGNENKDSILLSVTRGA